MTNLTNRELDILRLLPLTARQIGRRLGISEHTVRGYMTTLYLKLLGDVPHTKAAAIVMAARLGIIDPRDLPLEGDEFVLPDLLEGDDVKNEN